MENNIYQNNKPAYTIIIKDILVITILLAALPIGGILFISFINNTWLSVVATIALIAGTYLFFISRFVRLASANIEKFNSFYNDLAKGNLPAPPKSSVSILQPVIHLQDELVKELNNIKAFFIEIGKGNLDNNVKVFDDSGELGNTISNVRAELRKVAVEDRQRNWTNEGLSKLGEILRKEPDLQLLSDKILSELVGYIGANQGYLFIVNDDDSTSFLELKSAFAYNKKKYLEKKIYLGEGLTGQAWIEGESIYLKEIPQNYVQITSGLGNANPNNILIVPLKNDTDIQGVLELASFKIFEPFEIAFVEKMAESIAVTFANVKTAEKTRRLLNDTKHLAEQLQSQEEEMRQNMEEMAATHEEMARKQLETDEHQRMMNSIMKSTPGAIYRSYTDSNWTMIYISPKVQQIVGYTPEDFIAKRVNLAAITHPDDVQYVEKQVHQAIRQYRQYELNYRLIHKNGEVVHVWETGEAVYDNEGKDMFIEGIIMDVTKDDALKKDMEQKQSLLNGLINNTEDNIMALDRNYNVTIINDRYKERYQKMGLQYDVGTNAFSVMDKSIHEEWKDYYDRALAGERFSFRKTFDDPTHTIVREYSFNPISDKEGNITGLSIFNRLINDTEKKEAIPEGLK